MHRPHPNPRTRAPRPALFALGLALSLLLAAPPAAAQVGKGMEEFEAVDPYTGGEPERMEKLGYVAFGSMPWRPGLRTPDVQEAVGAVSMLFVETEHFRIASSLGTYEYPGDREEKDRLTGELKRLKKKLGKFKPPKNELDPWLRLHLYAQRAEDLYQSFLDDFDLKPEDYQASGPYLGMKDKFLVLLCARKSEFGRYARTYLGAENEYSFYTGWPDECMFVGANVEALREGWTDPGDKPFDAMLHCSMAMGLASNFVDGFRNNAFGAPRWLGTALGHVYVRRIDPRWVAISGDRMNRNIREDDWEWEPRLANLVRNDFYASSETVFGWLDYLELDARDHMVAWSRLTYLLESAEGNPKGFLAELCSRNFETDPEVKRKLQIDRQTAALASHYGMTPEELDEAWARWAKREYR